MLHEEVFWGVGADHRFGDGDEPDFFPFEDRPSGGGFERIAKQPIELMDNNNVKSPIFSNGVRKQLFEGLSLFKIPERRLAFLKIFFGNRIAVLFRPFTQARSWAWIEKPCNCSSEETRA